MRNKLITLDEESFAISKQMANFSSFVRMATKATRDGDVELVNPSEMTAMRALVIAFNRLQLKDGGNSPRVDAILEIMNDLRIEERAES
tara:strand:+ start:131 stop:397 length:267 start_codon:yes stop_codon:yes gene_type:complete